MSLINNNTREKFLGSVRTTNKLIKMDFYGPKILGFGLDVEYVDF